MLLEFAPSAPAAAGDYAFDVGLARAAAVPEPSRSTDPRRIWSRSLKPGRGSPAKALIAIRHLGMAKMGQEPGAGVLDDGLHRARLLEQMRGAGHDGQLFPAA